jgi:mannose-6-phosphate isomerase-like protein (cupin superfamily)
MADGSGVRHAAQMGRPFVLGPTEGRHLDLGNFGARVLATGDETDGLFSLLETHAEPVGFGPPMHIHHDAAEAFFVLEGDYSMHIEEEQYACPPGSFVYVPAGVRHTFSVRGPGAGRKLNLFTPQAMVGFFEELAAAEAAGTADEEQLGRISARHHMEVVGPVPDNYL